MTNDVITGTWESTSFERNGKTFIRSTTFFKGEDPITNVSRGGKSPAVDMLALFSFDKKQAEIGKKGHLYFDYFCKGGIRCYSSVVHKEFDLNTKYFSLEGRLKLETDGARAYLTIWDDDIANHWLAKEYYY